MFDRLYSIQTFAKLVGVTPQTLRNWEKSNKLIPAKRAANGYRYYSEIQRLKLLNISPRQRVSIGYCRIDSKESEESLTEQVTNVKAFMASRGYEFEIITDIGSDTDYTKYGLEKLIEKILTGEVDNVVVMRKDTLMKFGLEIMESVAKRFETKIIIMDKTEEV